MKIVRCPICGMTNVKWKFFHWKCESCKTYFEREKIIIVDYNFKK